MKFQITFTIILVLLSRIVQIEMRETLYDKLYENNLKQSLSNEAQFFYQNDTLINSNANKTFRILQIIQYPNNTYRLDISKKKKIDQNISPLFNQTIINNKQLVNNISQYQNTQIKMISQKLNKTSNENLINFKIEQQVENQSSQNMIKQNLLQDQTQIQKGSQSHKFVTYINSVYYNDAQSLLKSLGVPQYAQKNEYNYFILGFWNNGAQDASKIWANIETYVKDLGTSRDEIQKNIIKNFHQANKKLMVSAFGGTVEPIAQGMDAKTTCQNLAYFCKEHNLDGVDIDFEDNGAFEQGKAEQWLIECTKEIRKILPSDQYIVSHAPQAPYFMGKIKYPNNGYLKIHQEVGHFIDFYNIQFYNQQSTSYSTYESLFEKSDGWAVNSSIKEIINSGVSATKIVLGKPCEQKNLPESNTGLVSSQDLKNMIRRQNFWNTGIMTWQFSSDLDGQFINPLSEAFYKK